VKLRFVQQLPFHLSNRRLGSGIRHAIVYTYDITSNRYLLAGVTTCNKVLERNPFGWEHYDQVVWYGDSLAIDGNGATAVKRGRAG
jgi:hypothetical protein